MSRTSPRPRRLGRLAAGLAVAAASVSGTLLGVTPAYAQGDSLIASMSDGVLIVNGATGANIADGVSASGGNGTIRLSNLQGPITAGRGCVQLGATVQCSGVNTIYFNGFGGDDTFRNNTSTPSRLFGSSGNDRLTGGSANDQIDGGSGVDFAFGQGGFDTCTTAENRSSCEA
jgi:Ca2+-binding RTX toxin-like protein